MHYHKQASRQRNTNTTSSRKMTSGYIIPVLCLLFHVGIDAQTCSDTRGTAVCQSMIAAFKKLNPYPSNPSYAFTGNKCTIAGDPYNLFRPTCCLSCRTYRKLLVVQTTTPAHSAVSGSAQAQKDASYMNINPTPTPTCADSSTATTRCNVSV